MFIISNASEVIVNDCHVLSNNERSVDAFSNLDEPMIYDFRNNYWGTPDAELVEAMIFDGNDEAGNNSVVLFGPYSDVPVPTETTTLDSIKAMYRDGAR